MGKPSKGGSKKTTKKRLTTKRKTTGMPSGKVELTVQEFTYSRLLDLKLNRKGQVLVSIEWENWSGDSPPEPLSCLNRSNVLPLVDLVREKMDADPGLFTDSVRKQLDEAGVSFNKDGSVSEKQEETKRAEKAETPEVPSKMATPPLPPQRRVRSQSSKAKVISKRPTAHTTLAMCKEENTPLPLAPTPKTVVSAAPACYIPVAPVRNSTVAPVRYQSNEDYVPQLDLMNRLPHHQPIQIVFNQYNAITFGGYDPHHYHNVYPNYAIALPHTPHPDFLLTHQYRWHNGFM